MRRGFHAQRLSVAIFVSLALLLIPSLALAVDASSHSGIIVGVTGRGSEGYVSARVGNSWSVSVSGSISFTTQNNNGGTTTTTYNYTLAPGQSQNFVVNYPTNPFSTSTINAQQADSNGTTTSGDASTWYVTAPCGSPNRPECEL